MESSQTTLAQFTTNSFVGNPIGVIIKGTAAGMGLMFVGISMGMPVFVSMALLFAGIGLVYGYIIGKVQYTLLPNGMEQKIRRFIPYYLSKDEEKRFITWEQIHSFKNDTDYSRQAKEYEYIKLYLNVPPKEIWITNQIDEVGFNRFKAAFLLKMEEFKPENPNRVIGNTDESNRFSNSVETISKNSNRIVITKKESFYKSIFAKLLTVFFVAVTVCIAYVGFTLNMRFTNWIKFGIVILPGTIYMVYRVFIRSNK